MNISYFSSSYIPSRFANSIHVMKMCQAFTKNGHKVTVFAKKGDKIKCKNDIYSFYGVNKTFEIKLIKHIPLRQLGDLIFSLIASKIYSINADICYGRHPLSLLLASNRGVPIIYEVHNLPDSKYTKVVESHLFQKSNFKRLVCISESLKKEYLISYPFLENKIIVAHDGADIPEEIGKENLLKLEKGKSGLCIGYVGHLYPGKGMEIISEIAKKMPDEIFHIVGGFDEDIKKWKDSSSENIIFHGFVPHSQIGNYYRAFHIILAPFQRRVTVLGTGDIGKFTSPLKIFEAMSYGRAIITSDIPVIQEVFTNRKDAILCSPENIDEWVEAINYLKKNQKAINELGRQAKSKFMDNYTWEKRAKEVINGLDNARQ